MFKSPFSFKGRIRRTEYGLSVLIYSVASVLVQAVTVYSAAGSGRVELWYLLFLLPVIFFLLAQGTKRCHDLGNSGWFQLIPLYGLWLLFADGEKGPNEYGDNPKGLGNHSFTFENAPVEATPKK